MIPVTIDIETFQGSEWFVKKLEADVQAPGNYKNPESILKWFEETGNAKRAEAGRMTALTPFCKIVAIGYAVGDGPVTVLAGSNEFNLLSQFVDDLRQKLTHPVRGFHNPMFVGHNILSFDMPRLYQRMVINSIDPDAVRIKSPALIKGWDDAYFDTLNVFAGRDTKGCSLGNLCKEFGIDDPMPDMDGSKVHDLVVAGDFVTLAQYCKSDVEMTRELAKRLGCNYDQ